MGSKLKTDTYQVLRGGSWDYCARVLRASFRDGDALGFRDHLFGFRLVKTVKVDKQLKRWREEVEEGLFDEK